MPAMKLRLKRSSGANVQRANALGSVNFVRGDGKQIHSETVHVERHLPRRLHRVTMEVNVSLGGDSANFLNRLNGAEFVVRMHHADQNCLRPQRAANVLGIHDTAAADRNVGDFDSLLFKRLRGIQHRVMLNRRRNYMLARLIRSHYRAKQREVVSFGASAREHNFRWLRADKSSDGIASSVQPLNARAVHRNESSWHSRNFRRSNGSMASRTARSTGVVAL